MQGIKRCSQCQSLCPDDAHFCAKCGTDLRPAPLYNPSVPAVKQDAADDQKQVHIHLHLPDDPLRRYLMKHPNALVLFTVACIIGILFICLTLLIPYPLLTLWR